MDLSTLTPFVSSYALPQPKVSSTQANRMPSEEQKAHASETAQASEETDSSASRETTGPTRPDGTPLAPEEIQYLEQVAAQARQYLLEAKLEAAREQSEMNAARSAREATTEEVTTMPDEQAA